MMSRRAVLRLLPAMVGLPAPGAQPPALFRTRVDAVRIDALVLDRGRPVPNLSAADFAVSDSGERQAIRVERIADLPLDVILVLDTSNSVDGPLLGHLVGGVRALVGGLRPDDRAALVGFSHVVATLAGFEAPRVQLLAALDHLDAVGNTSVLDAVSTALALAGRERPTLLLVFSDGYDTASWLTPAKVLEQARQSDVVVDAVVVGELRQERRIARGVDRREWLDAGEEFIGNVTALTGGRQFDGERGARLGERFSEALALFRERYQITFTSTVDRPGWHPVEIRVPRRRGVTIRARAGFWQ